MSWLLLRLSMGLACLYLALAVSSASADDARPQTAARKLNTDLPKLDSDDATRIPNRDKASAAPAEPRTIREPLFAHSFERRDKPPSAWAPAPETYAVRPDLVAGWKPSSGMSLDFDDRSETVTVEWRLGF